MYTYAVCSPGARGALGAPPVGTPLSNTSPLDPDVDLAAEEPAVGKAVLEEAAEDIRQLVHIEVAAVVPVV